LRIPPTFESSSTLKKEVAAPKDGHHDNNLSLLYQRKIVILWI